MTVIYPCDVANVSDSYQDHVDRGSVNPGTDYTAAWGSEVRSVSSGVVTDTTSTFGGSGGRMVHIDHDDGTGADYLHLSSIGVHEGQRVAQGEVIALSGASGLGSEWGYGAHLHISYRRSHGNAYMNVGNIDFDSLIRSQTTSAVTGGGTPINNGKDDEEMRAFFRLAQGQAAIGNIKPGTILSQEEPGAPLLFLTPEQWKGYAKYGYTDLTTAEMRNLVSRVGTYILVGGHQVKTGTKPYQAYPSWNGYHLNYS